MSIYYDIDEETRKLLENQFNCMEVDKFPNTNPNKKRPWHWYELKSDLNCNCWLLTKRHYE